MWKRLLHTNDEVALTIIRIALGVVMFPHGAQKALGWFGGGGWSGTMGFFTGQLGVPSFVVVLIILGEFLGAIGLVVGAVTRVAAFGILVIQLGAVWMVHRPVGFFMNWYGSQQGEGYEYGLLAIAMALALVIRGAGRWSVDRAVGTKA